MNHPLRNSNAATLALPEERRERMRPPLSQADHVRHTPLVRRIAMRVARRVPRDVAAVEDLIAYRWLGLLEANSRADVSLNEEEFTAYASYRVRGAMLDYLRMLDPMVRRLRARSRDIANAVADLSHELGRAPEEDEIARKVALSLDDYRVSLQRIAEVGMARLDVIDFEEIANVQESADDQVDRKHLIDAVAAAIPHLPERLRYIVALHYQEDCTLTEIAQILGLTVARISQLHSEAIHRLRATMGVG